VLHASQYHPFACLSLAHQRRSCFWAFLLFLCIFLCIYVVVLSGF
jgi:hypothetical protein